DYFPSYESVMLTRRPEVWEDDLIHVAPAFIGRVMLRVADSYVPDAGDSLTRRDAELWFVNAVEQGRWDDAGFALERLESDFQSHSLAFHLCRAEFERHRGDAAAALSAVARAMELLPPRSPDAVQSHLRCARVAQAVDAMEIAERQRDLLIAALLRAPVA